MEFTLFKKLKNAFSNSKKNSIPESGKEVVIRHMKMDDAKDNNEMAQMTKAELIDKIAGSKGTPLMTKKQ